MADRFPGIPAISGRIDPETSAVLRPVVEILRQFVGGNLPQAGIIGGLQRLGLSDGAGNLTIPPGLIAYDNTPPPAPTGLEVMGAIQTMILSWDAVPIEVAHRVAYVEIWRSETNDIGTAQLVGQARGEVYTDVTGPAATRYYWIRYAAPGATSPPIAGPFNAQAGTQGQTGQDALYLIDMLAAEGYDTLLYKQENPSLVINGVPIPVGVYMRDAFIGNGTITNAKIANAAIDNAKIANLAVGSAKIADAAITNAKIADATITEAKIGNAAIGYAKLYGDMYSDDYYPSGGASGWLIQRNGNAYFQNGDFRGDIHAANLYGNVVNTGNIVDNAVSASNASEGTTSTSATITSTGARTVIFARAVGGNTTSDGGKVTITIKRGGTTLAVQSGYLDISGYGSVTTFVVEVPPGGSITYTADVTTDAPAPSTPNCYLYVQQLKK